ncbi:hypothetical protein ABW19_dt0206822 [Dactylella cylindrospora]|nr:hypothetical protein ABW19_dt0206822 [Dactylella cylindrospora]
MATATPKRKFRDPNEIFTSLDKPLSPTKPAPINTSIPASKEAPNELTTPTTSPTKAKPPAAVQRTGTTTRKSSTKYTKPQIVTNRRVLSISKRFMGTTGSLLRRTGSPPRGRRSPPPRKGSVRKGGGGIKPPLDLGPQHSNFDTVNVRERVRKWQAAGGGVVEADTNNYVPPPAPPRDKSPEKRRTMLAGYTTNNNFDELETSSARWGMEPLALPAPPAMPALSGYGSHPGSRRGSIPGSVGSHREAGEWEDAVSGAEMSGREDRSAWNSAAEETAVKAVAKKRKKRVPREGMDAEAIRARKERRRQRLISANSNGPKSARETEDEKSVKGDHLELEDPVEVPGKDLEGTEGNAIVTIAEADVPPPPPAHALSAPASLKSKHSMKSLEDTPASLKSKKSVKSLEGTPPSILSHPSREGTPASSLVDDDGIRVTPLRRKFTKAEKHERHKQRQAEREEMLEREKARIREEERLRYQEIERIKEEERQKERQKEIERIKEEERQRVLDEERIREEERRKIRELDLKMQREREEQKKRERDRDERRRQRELLRQQEREREIERIKEEEKLKVIEEMRQERERERQELERERALLEEQRRRDREEERHNEIMWEIEQATQRSTTRAKKKRKDKGTAMAEEVEKRVGSDITRSKEETTDAIKQAVREVMSELFGEIIIEDEGRTHFSNERSNGSSSIPTDLTTSETKDHEVRTRETTPEVEKKSPQPPHNDITFRVAEFRSKTPELEPELEVRPKLPPEPEPAPPEEPVEEPPPSPETPTKTSIFSLPKRRLGLFGSPTKRRRKPFQATIPEESSSQLSTNEPEEKSPPGHRVFSFAPRTAAEPISPPTRQVSTTSRSGDPASPPARQFSIASRTSQHTDYSDHTTASSQIHPNLPNDENLTLPGFTLSSGLTRSLTSPASHTNLARDADPGDEYFVSVHEPLKKSGIKRYKSTADLISILSERKPSSAGRAKSIKSTRSIRSVKNKVVVSTLTLNDLLIELATEELSYTQDLILLEHRIVPVLMEAKLAKTDKEAMAGKRASPEKLMENNPLKAIVDVNIALKRLNAVHEKLSDAINASQTSILTAEPESVQQADPLEILKWAQSAKYVYEDYISFWRMDWDEVVINTDVLEAIEKNKAAAAGSGMGSAAELSAGLTSSAINGKTIDVGYLLKRPLVRTRVLAKLFKVRDWAIFSSSSISHMFLLSLPPLKKERIC